MVDTLYVDLIERYTQAEGAELKDVVNLAFHEFFERRQYLPEERNLLCVHRMTHSKP